MAIYEYYCPDCEKIFELMRPISEAHEKAKCPTCGRECERLISSFASEAGSYVRPGKEPFRKLPIKGEGKGS